MSEQPADLKRPLIVIADDDPTSRAVTQKIAAGLEFGVLIANNGRELLELVRQHKPELVITDALMPYLDGREAARIIKEEFPGTRVVLMTSVYKDNRYKNEAMFAYKADAYLIKPVSPRDLRAAIVQNLAKRQE
jgi:two-component system response regulator YesN